MDYHLFLTYIGQHHEDLLKLLGGAAGLSVVLEAVLLKLKNSRWHVDSKKLSFTLLHVLTIATSVATYLIGNLPKADAGTVYATLTIAAEAWHRFAVSPLFGKYIVPFLQYLSSTKPATAPASTAVQRQSLDPSGSVSPDAFLGE